MHGVRPGIIRVSGGKGRPGLVVNTRVIVELVIARPLRLPLESGSPATQYIAPVDVITRVIEYILISLKLTVVFLGHELPVHAARVVEYEHDNGRGSLEAGIQGDIGDTQAHTGR